MISLDEDAYVYVYDKHMISHKKGLKKSTSGFVQNLSQKCKVLLMCVFFIEMYVSFGVKHYFLRQNWIYMLTMPFLHHIKKNPLKSSSGFAKNSQKSWFFFNSFFSTFCPQF